MTQEEIKNQIEAIRKVMGKDIYFEPSIAKLTKFFNKDYNDPFTKGVKVWVDLTILFENDKTRKWKSLFDNEPWQPATITYRRGDILFFKWDNYPKYKEEWICADGSNMNLWNKIMMLQNVKYSVLFKKKIKKLSKKDPDELAIKIGVFDIDTKNGLIKVDNDL